MMMVTIIPTQAFAGTTILPFYKPKVVEDKLGTQITTSANFVIGEPVTYYGKGFEVILCITDQSEDTFDGEIKINNTSDWEIENWHIGCDLKNEIVDIQNAEYNRQEDNICMIKGIRESAVIRIGESITIPFKAAYSEEIELPSYFMLYEEIDYENVPEDEEEYRIWKEKISIKEEGRKATRKAELINRAIQFAAEAEEPKTGSISNDYVKFNYLNGRYGLFTTGGNPDDPNDDNKKLLFGDGDTSYTTIRIDGTNYQFSPDTVTRYVNKIIGTKRYGDIIVSQHIGIISNQYTKRDDVVEFFYTVENTSGTPHEVGVRIMFDTMLGGNDYAPFRLPGIGDVTTETDLSGADIPEFWQAFDSLSKPSVIAQGTLNIDKSSTPDRVRFTNWGSARSNPWDYTRLAGSSNGDSAVCLYWNEQELSEGDTLSCKTFYGLSALQQDLRPPLSVALTGATRLEVVKNKDGKEEYSPNPFTVTAYIQNIGTGTATNARITLNLPSGMEIVEGEKTVDLGDIPVGTKQYQVSWKVKVAPSPVDKTEKYGVTVVADNADEKTLEREIFVPKLQGSGLKVLLNKSRLTNGPRLNLEFKIINTSDTVLELKDILARYYLMDESPNIAKNIERIHVQTNFGQQVSAKAIVEQNLSPTKKDANAFLEIGFSGANNQLKKNEWVKVEVEMSNRNSNDQMKVTNDFSYKGDTQSVTGNEVEWLYIPLYNIKDKQNPIHGNQPSISNQITSIFTGVVYQGCKVDRDHGRLKATLNDVEFEKSNNTLRIKGNIEVEGQTQTFNLSGGYFRIKDQPFGDRIYINLNSDATYDVLACSIQKEAHLGSLYDEKEDLEGKDVFRITLKDKSKNRIIDIEDRIENYELLLGSISYDNTYQNHVIKQDMDTWYVDYVVRREISYNPDDYIDNTPLVRMSTLNKSSSPIHEYFYNTDGEKVYYAEGAYYTIGVDMGKVFTPKKELNTNNQMIVVSKNKEGYAFINTVDPRMKTVHTNFIKWGVSLTQPNSYGEYLASLYITEAAEYLYAEAQEGVSEEWGGNQHKLYRLGKSLSTPQNKIKIQDIKIIQKLGLTGEKGEPDLTFFTGRTNIEYQGKGKAKFTIIVPIIADVLSMFPIVGDAVMPRVHAAADIVKQVKKIEQPIKSSDDVLFQSWHDYMQKMYAQGEDAFFWYPLQTNGFGPTYVPYLYKTNLITIDNLILSDVDDILQVQSQIGSLTSTGNIKEQKNRDVGTDIQITEAIKNVYIHGASRSSLEKRMEIVVEFNLVTKAEVIRKKIPVNLRYHINYY